MRRSSGEGNNIILTTIISVYPLSHITLQPERFDHLSLFQSTTELQNFSQFFSSVNPSDFWHRVIQNISLSSGHRVLLFCVIFLIEMLMVEWMICVCMSELHLHGTKKEEERMNKSGTEYSIVVPGNLCFMELTLILDTHCL